MSTRGKNLTFLISQPRVLKLLLAPYFLMSSIYWWVVKIIVKAWGRRGLHAISVGDFVAGEWKARSFYRQDMLLRAIPLFVDLRGKSCLDLACADGFWSFRLGYFGIKKLIGIDLSQENILRANFLKTVYNFTSFDFKCRDIFQFLYHENQETFDIILLLSILYHLPSESDWDKFFKRVSQINEYCLIIDTRCFDNDEYWYDKTSGQAIIKTEEGIVKKWRPTRKEIFSYLYQSGYEQVLEVNPSSLLTDQKEAYGNGDPYTLQNVSDYITNNRILIIAYKRKLIMPDIENRLLFREIRR